MEPLIPTVSVYRCRQIWLDEMLLCKDQSRRPPPKFGLAKAFSQVTSMLLDIEGMTALCHVSYRIQDLQEGGVTGVHLELLEPLSWASAHQEQDGPGALGSALNLVVASKVPGHCVGRRKPTSLYQLVLPVKYILTPHWLHQLFEPFCLLTKSLQRNPCP